jgi:hypothetical protein
MEAIKKVKAKFIVQLWAIGDEGVYQVGDTFKQPIRSNLNDTNKQKKSKEFARSQTEIYPNLMGFQVIECKDGKMYASASITTI